MAPRFLSIGIFLMMVFSGRSQYYYKDIMLTRQNRETWKSLHDQKVRSVDIESIDANNEPTPGFVCKQTISNNFRLLSHFQNLPVLPHPHSLQIMIQTDIF